MSEWGAINSEYEVTEADREDYAFAIYCDGAHKRARAKAEADLQHRKDRGEWPPLILSENGAAYMKRTVPLKRRSQR